MRQWAEHPGVLAAATLAAVDDQSPSGKATRVSPPGSTQTSSPLLTANGRRSTWRGCRQSSISVGTVDWTTGCAIQPRGPRSPDSGAHQVQPWWPAARSRCLYRPSRRPA